ncbi:MAG TPA: sigma-70 family RNA polymerase sigma factor [Thermomicrobiales bacterium]|nr:sigma-70 family RNA polymerase sigma factor [Thermomicrobiales bacterium]
MVSKGTVFGQVGGRAVVPTASLPLDSDEALAVAARTDAECFSQLYLRYSNRIYRYAISRTRSATAADDIVSDTMMSALEGINGFNPDRGSFASWIFTIASRRIADRDRKSRQFWRYLARRGHHEEHDEDALTTTLRLERRDDVRQAISRLTDQHQQVVLLRYVAELPIATIGEILDISEGAVKMRLQRALKRLAVELGGDE